MQNKKNNWLPHAMAMYNVIVWGTTFISTKVLLESFEPLEILIYRFVIGYIALWCIQPKVLKWQGRKKELAYFIAGLFGVTIYFLGENISLTMTYTGNVSIIVSTAPLFTAICACLLTKSERPTKYFWGGFVLAIVGIAMINVGGTQIDAKFHPERLVQPVNAGNILFLGILATAGAYATWNYAVARLGVMKSSVYIYLIPVITIICSAIILDEKITIGAVCGCLLTMAGLFLSEKKEKIIF